MNIKKALIFLVCFIVLAVIKIRITISENRKINYAYFKDLNLVLTGIVTDRQIVTNNAGILYVDIRSTTIPDYDVRASAVYYYCVIHKNKAEIIEGGLAEMQAGDSIVVNSKIDSFECFQGDKLIFKWPLNVVHPQNIVKGVRELHRL